MWTASASKAETAPPGAVTEELIALSLKRQIEQKEGAEMTEIGNRMTEHTEIRLRLDDTLVKKVDALRGTQMSHKDYLDWYWGKDTEHTERLKEAATVDQMLAVLKGAMEDFDQVRPTKLTRGLHNVYVAALKSYESTLQKVDIDFAEMRDRLKKDSKAFRSSYYKALSETFPDADPEQIRHRWDIDRSGRRGTY